MYTAAKLGDVIDREKSRRIVTAQFTNGTETFQKDFSFRVEEHLAVIKRAIAAFLDELNFVPETVDDFTVVEPTPIAPTAAELAKLAWEADWAKLQKVQLLIAAGVLTGTETAVTNLRAKVTADFKPAYL